MISKHDFARIDNEVKLTINGALDYVRIKSPSNYILYLADADYKENYDNDIVRLNPHVIDNKIDYFKDESRLEFLTEFLNNYYSFKESETVDNNKYRLHIELMAYTHIWESKPFLRKLHRLAHLSNLEEYNWKVVVPDMGNPGKHEFIRNDIRNTFEQSGSNLYSIMKEGYHSSLRNAFAHSDYSFDTMNDRNLIWLDNFKGKDWELKNISFDDWAKRFVYSALLSYHLVTISHQKRTSVIKDFGTDTFKLKLPKSETTFINVEVVYREISNEFNFKR